MPVDPVSAGTWIACTDAGLVLCRLNTNPGLPGPAASEARRSRGEIVPVLLESESLSGTLDSRDQFGARGTRHCACRQRATSTRTARPV